MLRVNGQQVPVSSRKSEALRAYSSRSARLQDSTNRSLRLNITQGPAAPDKAFCSVCGRYVPVSTLAFWFEGELCAFYQCAGGCK